MGTCTFTGSYIRDPRGPKFKDGGPRNAGPDGWKFLHLSALDGKLTQKIVDEFASCIECTSCKRHFLQLIKDSPIPANADSDKQFEISHGWHNKVNQIRDVSTISLAEARNIWGTQGGTLEAGTRKTPSLRAERPKTGGDVLASMVTRGSPGY